MTAIVTTVLRRQIEVVAALCIREIKLRNSKQAFAYLFDLLDLMVFILLMSLVFTLLGRSALVGDSVVMFVTTGIFPILLFRSVSMRSGASLKSVLANRDLHVITPLDAALARSLVEFFTFTLVVLIILFSVYIFRISQFAIPYDGLLAVEALVGLYGLGLAFGLVNSTITAFVPLWTMAWSIFARTQIFFCAVFSIPEYMPAYVRDIIAWHPLAHLVAMTRRAFFPMYPTHFIDVQYVVLWIFGTTIVGLSAQRVTSGYLRSRSR